MNEENMKITLAPAMNIIQQFIQSLFNNDHITVHEYDQYFSNFKDAYIALQAFILRKEKEKESEDE